jgi:hypothetical protein
MENEGADFNRNVRVPRLLRVVIGIPLSIIGLLFLLLLENLFSPPADHKDDIVGTAVLILTVLLFSGSFTYVGVRLINLKTHAEPLFSERAWVLLIFILGLTGASSCVAAVVDDSIRLLYAAFGVLLLGASWFLHTVRKTARL